MKAKERGQSLVEAALLFPVVLMLLLGVLDFGRAYYIAVALRDAADEGAAYAAISPADYAGIQVRAAEASQGMLELAPEAVTVTYPPVVVPGAPITVTVAYSMPVFTPFVQEFFPGDVIFLQGQAAKPIIVAQ